LSQAWGLLALQAISLRGHAMRAILTTLVLIIAKQAGVYCGLEVMNK